MPTDEYQPNRWRKRPVVITAQRMSVDFHVDTLEGRMEGRAGDWLITGVKGEQYPCADDIFRATYEPVADVPRPLHTCDHFFMEWVGRDDEQNAGRLKCIRCGQFKDEL